MDKHPDIQRVNNHFILIGLYQTFISAGYHRMVRHIDIDFQILGNLTAIITRAITIRLTTTTCSK